MRKPIPWDQMTPAQRKRKYCQQWTTGKPIGSKTTGTITFSSQCGYPKPCQYHARKK